MGTFKLPDLSSDDDSPPKQPARKSPVQSTMTVCRSAVQALRRKGKMSPRYGQTAYGQPPKRGGSHRGIQAARKGRSAKTSAALKKQLDAMSVASKHSPAMTPCAPSPSVSRTAVSDSPTTVAESDSKSSSSESSSEEPESDTPDSPVSPPESASSPAPSTPSDGELSQTGTQPRAAPRARAAESESRGAASVSVLETPPRENSPRRRAPPRTSFATQCVVPAPAIGHHAVNVVGTGHGEYALVSNPGAQTAPPAPESPAGTLDAAGLTPTRVIVCANTSDEFVLCSTAAGDNLYVYFSREKARPLRAANVMFPDLPVDAIGDRELVDPSQMAAFFAERLFWSAGAAADAADDALRGSLFGVMAAASEYRSVAGMTLTDDVLSRYAAVLHVESNGAADVKLLFGQSPGAEAETAAVIEEGDTAFIRASSVFPIAHFHAIERDVARGRAAETALSVREASRMIEEVYIKETLSEIDNGIRRSFKRLSDRVNALSAVLPLVVGTRERELDALGADAAIRDGAASDHPTAYRIAELSLLRSRVSDAVSALWADVDMELAASERVVRGVLGELFVESRTVLAPAADRAGAPLPWFCRGKAWELPPEIDRLDFAPVRSGGLPIADTDALADWFNHQAPEFLLSAIRAAPAGR